MSSSDSEDDCSHSGSCEEIRRNNERYSDGYKMARHCQLEGCHNWYFESKSGGICLKNGHCCGAVVCCGHYKLLDDEDEGLCSNCYINMKTKYENFFRSIGKPQKWLDEQKVLAEKRSYDYCSWLEKEAEEMYP